MCAVTLCTRLIKNIICKSGKVDPLNSESIVCEVKPTVVTPLQCEFCDFTCATNNEIYLHYSKKHDSIPSLLLRLEIVKKSGDNYSLSADFFANSSHIMVGAIPV